MNAYRLMSLSGLLYHFNSEFKPAIDRNGFKCQCGGIYTGYCNVGLGLVLYRRKYTWNLTPSGRRSNLTGSVTQYTYPSNLFNWWPE